MRIHDHTYIGTYVPTYIRAHRHIRAYMHICTPRLFVCVCVCLVGSVGMHERKHACPAFSGWHCSLLYLAALRRGQVAGVGHLHLRRFTEPIVRSLGHDDELQEFGAGGWARNVGRSFLLAVHMYLQTEFNPFQAAGSSFRCRCLAARQSVCTSCSEVSLAGMQDLCPVQILKAIRL